MAKKERVYFSIRDKEKRVVMFRYLLDTQRERVLERDKGGGKRLKCRKAVRNAIAKNFFEKYFKILDKLNRI